MTKTLSKILAVVLSVCMIFAVPVMANAEDVATFALTGSLDSVTGNWDDDYVETIAVKVNGKVATVTDGAVITLGVGAENSTILTFNADSVGLAITNNESVVVFLPIANYISHAETYHFNFAEGTFVAEDGSLSEALTVTVTGNDIIETLEVEHVSTKPIEKLIDWMYTWGAEGFWLDVIDFIVEILEWFLYI